MTHEIYRIRDEKHKAQVKNTGRDDLRKRNAEMSILLRKQPTVIKEYDEKLVRRLIDKVTVYEDRFEVVFRSGDMVEVEGYLSELMKAKSAQKFILNAFLNDPLQSVLRF